MITVLLVLATWRVSSLFANEDGPFDIFARIRHRAGVYYDEYSQPQANNLLAKGLICIWCVSIWIGFFASFFDTKSVNIHTFVINWLAISAGAIFLDEILQLIIRK